MKRDMKNEEIKKAVFEYVVKSIISINDCSYYFQGEQQQYEEELEWLDEEKLEIENTTGYLIKPPKIEDLEKWDNTIMSIISKVFGGVYGLSACDIAIKDFNSIVEDAKQDLKKLEYEINQMNLFCFHENALGGKIDDQVEYIDALNDIVKKG